MGGRVRGDRRRRHGGCEAEAVVELQENKRQCLEYGRRGGGDGGVAGDGRTYSFDLERTREAHL